MSVQLQLTTARRGIDVGRGLTALVVLVVLVAGVPVALIAWVGSPLPAGMPTVSQLASAVRDTYISDSFLVKALALVCWLVWAELIASLIVEAIAYARGRSARPVPLAGVVQRGATHLIATLARLGALVPTKSVATAAGRIIDTLAPVAQPVVTLAPGDDDGEVAAQAVAAVGADLAPAPTYEVQRRDTLWDIAERHLGDPFRWHEIFRLNQGRAQADGTRLTDPDLLGAGWLLVLPADARGLSPTEPPAHDAPAAPAAPARAPARRDHHPDDE